MPDWLTALTSQTGSSVLVTVAATQGSVPREAGTKMLVTADAQFDTIGGGHLEWRACAIVREMLKMLNEGEENRHNRLERMPLGPTLGQCCGGVAWLAFEWIEEKSSPFSLLRQRIEERQESWRLVPLDTARAVSLFDHEGNWIVGPTRALPEGISIDDQTECAPVHAIDGSHWLLDPIRPHPEQLFLFGAGHVGTAIIRLLGTLPCQVVWVDEREELFPENLPANVTVEATDTPEAIIENALAGASFLVMTHSHALDQRLAEVILRKQNTGWFGLIGSNTKRIQFERRLLAHGVSEQRLAHMVCPIGIPGIEGKEPATIAIAVVAQLLQVWEKQAKTSEYATAKRAEPTQQQ